MGKTLVERANGERISCIAGGEVTGYYRDANCVVSVSVNFDPERYILSHFTEVLPVTGKRRKVRISIYGLEKDDIKGFISYRELPKEEIFTFVCDGTYEFRDVQ